MDRDLLEAFGLEEDEWIAVLVALLFMIPLLWFLMRGCAPVAQITDAGIPVELDAVLESEICSIDPIEAPYGFTGGELALTGQGRANSDIDIIVDGRTVETVRPNFNGVWSSDVNFEDAGEHVVVLSCLEADGTRSRSETALLGVTAEEIAEVVEPTARVEEAVATPYPTSVPRDTAVIEPVVRKAAPLLILSQFLGERDRELGGYTLRGTTNPGETVEILYDGQVIGTTTANDKGTWTFDVDLDEVGSRTYTARIIRDGETLTEDVNVNVVEPETAVVAPEEKLAPPTIDLGVVSTDSVEATGSAEPNAEVTIYRDGTAVATTTADASGNWSATLPIDRSVGTHEFTAETTEGQANASIQMLPNPTAMPEPTAVPEPTETPVPVIETGAISLIYSSPDIEEDGTLLGAPSIELIMDASWSMTLPTDSDAEADRLTADDPGSRIRIAKDSLVTVINDALPDGVPLAYRAFGADEGDRAACDVSGDLYVPLSPLDRGQLTGQVEATNPQFNAYTPLAASLREVPNDMASATGEIVVVLVTDGDERCDGDVNAAIASLAEQGIDVRVDIVGFAIADDALRDQFQTWAELGNGTYYDAGDVDELNQALTDAFAIPFRVVDGEGVTVEFGRIGGGKVEVPAGTYTIAVGGQEFEDVTIGGGEEVIFELE